MQIVVDERNRLLHADLSGFKSTVNLSHDYPVFQYASGVKPSKAVSLGCLWALPVGNWAKQATWNANGTIMVVGGLSNVVGAAHDRAGIAGRSETLRNCLVDGHVADLIEITCQRDIRAGGDDTADANQSDIPIGIRHLDPARDRG